MPASAPNREISVGLSLRIPVLVCGVCREDEIRGVPQRARHTSPRARGDHDVVFAGAAQVHRQQRVLISASRFAAARSNHRQPSQKLVQIAGPRAPRHKKRYLRLRRRKVPGERGSQSTAFSYSRSEIRPGFRIVEGNAKFALILAGEFAHFQRARFRRGFPVDVAGGILGQVFANAVEFGSPPAHKTFPLAPHQRQNLRTASSVGSMRGYTSTSCGNDTCRVFVRNAKGKRVASPKLSSR